jgi:hypothetical protein
MDTYFAAVHGTAHRPLLGQERSDAAPAPAAAQTLCLLNGQVAKVADCH